VGSSHVTRNQWDRYSTRVRVTLGMKRSAKLKFKMKYMNLIRSGKTLTGGGGEGKVLIFRYIPLATEPGLVVTWTSPG
jgi:hypothetical protein